MRIGIGIGMGQAIGRPESLDQTNRAHLELPGWAREARRRMNCLPPEPIVLTFHN